MAEAILSAPALFVWPLGFALLLAALQIVSFLGGGLPFGEAVTAGLEGSDLEGPADWINLGRVPLAILAMLLLASFGATGIALTRALPLLPAWACALIAAPAALLATKALGDGIARAIPRDETYATRVADLVGRIGRVTVGPLDEGAPGRVRVADAHGEPHTLSARPADRGVTIPEGSEVVVVCESDDEKGVYLVIPFDPMT